MKDLAAQEYHDVNVGYYVTVVSFIVNVVLMNLCVQGDNKVYWIELN